MNIITIYEGYITNNEGVRGFFSMTKDGLLKMINEEQFKEVTIRVKNED